MATWNVTAELLYRDAPWTGKMVRLWSRWPGWLGSGLAHFDEYTDNSGHAEFSIDDESGRLDDDTPICFTVRLNGTNYDFGPYELGGGAFTISLDPDEEPEEISPDDLCWGGAVGQRFGRQEAGGIGSSQDLVEKAKQLETKKWAGT